MGTPTAFPTDDHKREISIWNSKFLTIYLLGKLQKSIASQLLLKFIRLLDQEGLLRDVSVLLNLIYIFTIGYRDIILFKQKHFLFKPQSSLNLTLSQNLVMAKAKDNSFKKRLVKKKKTGSKSLQ